MSLRQGPIRELHEIFTPEELDRITMSQTMMCMHDAMTMSPPSMHAAMGRDFMGAVQHVREAFRAKWGPQRSAEQEANRARAMAVLSGEQPQDDEPEEATATFRGKTYAECLPVDRADWKAEDREGFEAVRAQHEQVSAEIAAEPQRFLTFQDMSPSQRAAYKRAAPEAYAAERAVHLGARA